jgi:hypothetical protein
MRPGISPALARLLKQPSESGPLVTRPGGCQACSGELYGGFDESQAGEVAKEAPGGAGIGDASFALAYAMGTQGIKPTLCEGHARVFAYAAAYVALRAGKR